MNKDYLFVRLLFLPFFKLDLNAKCAKNRQNARLFVYKLECLNILVDII